MGLINHHFLSGILAKYPSALKKICSHVTLSLESIHIQLENVAFHIQGEDNHSALCEFFSLTNPIFF